MLNGGKRRTGLPNWNIAAVPTVLALGRSVGDGGAVAARFGRWAGRRHGYVGAVAAVASVSLERSTNSGTALCMR